MYHQPPLALEELHLVAGGDGWHNREVATLCPGLNVPDEAPALLQPAVERTHFYLEQIMTPQLYTAAGKAKQSFADCLLSY